MKECACGSVLRSTEFKRHSKRGVEHKAVFVVAACVHCRRFCVDEGSRPAFYVEHRSCPTGLANNRHFLAAFKAMKGTVPPVSELK